MFLFLSLIELRLFKFTMYIPDNGAKNERTYDRTKVKKRSQILLKKVNELAEISDVKVYLLLSYLDLNLVYNSVNEDT